MIEGSEGVPRAYEVPMTQAFTMRQPEICCGRGVGEGSFFCF